MGRLINENYCSVTSGVHRGATSVASGEKIDLSVLRTGRGETICLAIAFLVARCCWNAQPILRMKCQLFLDNLAQGQSIDVNIHGVASIFCIFQTVDRF